MTIGCRGVRRALLWAGAIFGLAHAGCAYESSFVKPTAAGGSGSPVAQTVAKPPYDSMMASNSPMMSPYAVQRAAPDNGPVAGVRTANDQGGVDESGLLAAGGVGTGMAMAPQPMTGVDQMPDRLPTGDMQPAMVDPHALAAAQVAGPADRQALLAAQ